MQATLSQEHADFTLILPSSPTMEEVVQVPLYGPGTVCGLNDNYMGKGETWVMLQFNYGETRQFPYIVGE